MKKFTTIIPIITICTTFLLSSCQNDKKENTYVKKVQLNEETIAVGIYKPTGVEINNIQYIAEAINIDAGIVYVTLTDADVLKTKLDNIDVIVFPEMKNGEEFIALDDEIEEIFRDFIILKGKGAVAYCNGAGILTNSEENNSLNLIDVRIVENVEVENGLLNFELTDEGLNMFPELKDIDNVFVNYNSDIAFEIQNENSEKDQAIIFGNRTSNGQVNPIFLASKCGNGKVFLSAAHPETTPGMRWMLPRMIRWVYGKDPAWYNKNIVRPELYKEQFVFSDDVFSELEKLKLSLKEGSKSEQIDAMDILQNGYPWLAAEDVKMLLNEKNNDVKLRAAKYLLDIEYTFALKDFEGAIKNEKSKKVRNQLIEYRDLLENMTEQN